MAKMAKPPSAKRYPSLFEPMLRPTLLPPVEHNTLLRHSGVDASLVDSCMCRPWIRKLPSHKRTPSKKEKRKSLHKLTAHQGKKKTQIGHIATSSRSTNS
eukprot:918149-Ditylum_brightwellii.AAC.1